MNRDSMKDFIIFSLSAFKYLAILASACSFWLAFLHILVTCSLKCSFLSMVMPSNFIEVLPMIFSSPILTRLFS